MADQNIPSDLRYAETHEWVRVEGNTATIGISDFAQAELGDVVYLDLPWDGVGQPLTADKNFGNIESVKATSELVAPVSGTLSAVNDSLRDAPEQVNTNPYDQGWMLKVTLADSSGLDKLMDADAYKKFLETASGH